MKVDIKLKANIFAKSKIDNGLLKKEEMYEVENISMSRFSTSVELVIDKRKTYNSVDFIFYFEDDYSQIREIDIYKSALFNPYIDKNIKVVDLLRFVKSEQEKTLDEDCPF